MKLSKDEVLKIAKLSRLVLTDEEVGKFSGQLSDVLGYVGKLTEINTDNVEETSQVTGLTNVLRQDLVKNWENPQDLVEQAPDFEDGQVKVKPVF